MNLLLNQRMLFVFCIGIVISVNRCYGIAPEKSTIVPEENRNSTQYSGLVNNNGTKPEESFARSLSSGVYSCAMSMNLGCFVDLGDELVEMKRTELLAQADMEARGRADSQEQPSSLASAIEALLGEFSDLLGLSNFFKSAKEDDDDAQVKETEDAEEKDDDEDEDGKDEENSKSPGTKEMEEGRGKKKKKKIIKLLKLLLIAALIKAKIALILKLIAIKIQVKFFLVALAGLALNAARFYLDLKKGHQPQKVIYYEHAQHQHHYEGQEDDWATAPGGYWGRSYEVEAEEGDDRHGDGGYYGKTIGGKTKKKQDTGWSWFS